MRSFARLSGGMAVVALAGAAYRGVGTPDCIHSGQEAARATIARLTANP